MVSIKLLMEDFKGESKTKLEVKPVRGAPLCTGCSILELGLSIGSTIDILVGLFLSH